MADNTPNYMQSDLISDILWATRGRFKLAVTILIAVLAASLILFKMQRQVYEATASFTLGNIGLASNKSTLIPPPEQIIAGMVERYGPRYHRVDPGKPYLLSVDLSRKESSVIYLVSRGTVGKDTVDFLSALVTKELDNLKERVNNEIQAREQIINARRESLALLKQQLAKLHEKESSKQEALVSYIVTVEKANIHQQVNFLEYEIFALEADTRLLVSDQLKLLLPATLENGGKPIQPQLSRYLALGVVLGIFFGLLTPWLLAKLQPGGMRASYQT